MQWSIWVVSDMHCYLNSHSCINCNLDKHPNDDTVAIAFSLQCWVCDVSLSRRFYSFLSWNSSARAKRVYGVYQKASYQQIWAWRPAVDSLKCLWRSKAYREHSIMQNVVVFLLVFVDNPTNPSSLSEHSLQIKSISGLGHILLYRNW